MSSTSRSSMAFTFSGSDAANEPSSRRTYFLPSARQRASSSRETATPSDSKVNFSESQSMPEETRAWAAMGLERTWVSTKSSGTKRSQSSGSEPRPSDQNLMA